MRFPHYRTFMLVAALVFSAQRNATAQFIWDGDCSLDWYDCCNTGSAKTPEWRNNWTIAPNPNNCPALPGPDDHVTCVKTVILSGFFQTGVKSLTVTSTIDNAAHFSAYTKIDIEEFFVLSGNIIQPATYVLKNGTGDTIDLNGPKATATISSYATLDFQFDGGVVGPSTALLTNNGLMLKSMGGDGVSGLDIPVENNNTIRAIDGTLVFYQGCTNNAGGLIEALGDGEIRFQGPSTVLDGEVRGDGLIRFIYGVHTITGDYHPTNTLVAGGGGTVNFDVDTSLENLTLGNPNTIGGSGDLTIDDFLWNGGHSTLAPGGTTIVQDTMLIQHDSFAGGAYTVKRDLQLNGQSILDTNAVLYMNEAELRNDGEFELRGGTTIALNSSTPNSAIQNFGTIRRNGVGQTMINVPFLNFGDIAVESGNLNFDREMESSGPITLAAGTTLLLGHQLQVIHSTGSITGEGGVYFYNDFWSGDTTVDSMLGEYNVGTTTIQAGTMSFDTDGVIAPEKTTGTLNLIQGFGATKLQGSADLIVTDLLNWSSGDMAGTGTTFVHGPMILNNVGYWQSLSRILELHADSPLGPQPPSATLAINPPGTLRCKSVLIDGNVHNSGLVSPGTPTTPVAQLHLTGGYTQTAGGQLTLSKLGPAHDQLIVDGAAMLGGTLTATGYPTSGGDSFTIIVAGNVQGTFTQVNAPAGAQVIYAPTSVVLQAPGTPCPADIAPPTEGDNIVNVEDLLAVINAWGACPNPNNCPADINGDDQVNVIDLLAVINAWGLCP